MADADEELEMVVKKSYTRRSLEALGASRSTATLEAAKLEEVSIEGHCGPVLSVDAGDGLHYIFSGGEDCTARIWKFYQTGIQCYRLYHMLDHCMCQECLAEGVLSELEEVAVIAKNTTCKTCEAIYHLHPEQHEKRPAVTAVAFAGTCGPAISVTRLGTLHLTHVNTRATTRYRLFDKEIKDVRVKRDGEPDALGPWLISLVCGKEAWLYDITRRRNSFVIVAKASFLHDEDVMYAEHMPGDVSVGAALATCSANCISVWSLDGQQLSKLHKLGGRTFTCIRLSEPRDEWNWLVASSWEKDGEGNKSYFLSFWPLKSGMVVDEEAKREKGSPFLELSSGIKEEISDFVISPESDFVLVKYRTNSDFIQVAPSSQDPSGTIYKSYTLQMEGCPNKLFVEDVNFNKYNYLISLKHKSRCNDICMRLECDEEGDELDGQKKYSLAAVLAFQDGSVAVWDLQGADRGQKTSEMRIMSVLEILLPMMMRFFTFAQVITFAFGPSTNFSYSISKPISFSNKLVKFEFLEDVIPDHLSLADVFLPQAYSVMILATVYILLAVTGTHEKLVSLRMRVGHSKHFDKVVPMFKLFAEVANCEMRGELEVLLANPDIVCFHTFHWKLFGACAILLPIYFLTLLPYAIVMGDPTFVVQSSLFNVREWRFYAERQATLIYQGVMHPIAENVFFTRIFELCIKIMMPCIIIHTRRYPLMQTLAIFCCGLGSYLISLTHKPMVDRVMTSVIQAGQLFTAACMFSGVLTVLVPAAKDYSIGMLAFDFVFSVVFTYRSMPSKERGKLQNDQNQSYQCVENQSYQLMKECVEL